jgi:CheY-like chemotaxis protein
VTKEAQRNFRGSERILLVDDEEAVLRVNSYLLKGLGYEVEQVDRGVKAVELLRTWDADLVLLDMVMPEMDGVATLRTIREMRPEQTVIIFSAYAEPEKVEEVRQLGVYAYLIKPTPREILLGTLRDALDGNPAPPFSVQV